MITNFKTFINENLLVPRNLEGRKEKLKQINIRLLSQEVIDGDLTLDESFMDINPKFVKVKKVNGNVWLTGRQWTEIPEWLKNVEISETFGCSYNKVTSLKNCPHNIGINFWFDNNRISSLKGCPKNIVGDFDCRNNLLTSLDGCPLKIGGLFLCGDNLVKLELPENVKIGRKFYN